MASEPEVSKETVRGGGEIYFFREIGFELVKFFVRWGLSYA